MLSLTTTFQLFFQRSAKKHNKLRFNGSSVHSKMIVVPVGAYEIDKIHLELSILLFAEGSSNERTKHRKVSPSKQ